MTNTGIKATAEEIETLRAAAARGWRQGQMMIVSSLGEGIRKDEATKDAAVLCHEMALKHGLPEIPGYYGIAEDGEFVTA